MKSEVRARRVCGFAGRALGLASMALLSVTGCSPHVEAPSSPGRAAELERIEELARDAMERWRVPGMAMGIVMDGEVVYAAGLGHRDPDLQVEVTTATDFGLASMTKSFTALVIGLLVEDGVIGWDTPVHERCPELELSDPRLSAEVTFRDLLSHRTGLADKDELWTSGEYSAGEIFEHVDELQVAGPLRRHFEYSNVLYIAAAELAGRLTGSTWDAIARRRLLDPIGMTATGFSVEQLLQTDNYSFTFSDSGGELVANEFPGPEHHAWYFTRGSGSMYSNVEDMTRWMAFQLGEGEYGGRRIVSAATLRETHRPQMPLRKPPFYLDYPGISDHAYGLGWYLDTYRGHRRVHHGGASMGYSDYITLFPDDGIGIVILSNRKVMMPVELMYSVGDILLQLASEDWGARFAEFIPADTSAGQRSH